VPLVPAPPQFGRRGWPGADHSLVRPKHV
jgi:hypothetical protein